MPPEDKSGLRREQSEVFREIDRLLMQIESETIPERLLSLAQKLQEALCVRRKQLSVDGE